MTRGRNDRKRTNRRLRREMRWWNEECPGAEDRRHMARLDSIRPRWAATTATKLRAPVERGRCHHCDRLIMRDVQWKGESVSTTSPWRSAPYLIEELP